MVVANRAAVIAKTCKREYDEDTEADSFQLGHLDRAARAALFLFIARSRNADSRALGAQGDVFSARCYIAYARIAWA